MYPKNFTIYLPKWKEYHGTRDAKLRGGLLSPQYNTTPPWGLSLITWFNSFLCQACAPSDIYCSVALLKMIHQAMCCLMEYTTNHLRPSLFCIDSSQFEGQYTLGLLGPLGIYCL